MQQAMKRVKNMWNGKKEALILPAVNPSTFRI